MTPEAINEAVAKKLGWELHNPRGWYPPEFLMAKYLSNYQNHAPDYCRSIEAAWEIINYSIGLGFMVCLNYHDYLKQWYCIFAEKGKVPDSRVKYCDTAPMAIAICFLKLMGGLDNGKTARLRDALRKIANREHEDVDECVCYFGDNGYCCGPSIAEAALEEK